MIILTGLKDQKNHHHGKLKPSSNKYITRAEVTNAFGIVKKYNYGNTKLAKLDVKNINKLKESVDSGTYTPGKTIDFKYNENGHTRLIKALAPNDVVLQHTIADTTLLPTIKNYIIYGNRKFICHCR